MCSSSRRLGNRQLHDRQLHDRTVMVVGQTKQQAIMCLPVCYHDYYRGWEVDDGVRRHLQVRTTKPLRDNDDDGRRALDIEDPRTLPRAPSLPKAFVDLEHIYTIRLDDVRVIHFGNLAPESKEVLEKDHLEAH